MENKNSNKKILIIAIIIVAIAGLFFGLKYFAQKEKEQISYFIENEIENDIPESKNEIPENGNELTEPKDEPVKDEPAEEKEKTIEDFVQCLAQAGMVIYGSKTCPACASLVNSFGGYKRVEPIYVECSQERERCSQEMQTNYVPEIQIKGQIYRGARDFNSLGAATSCSI